MKEEEEGKQPHISVAVDKLQRIKRISLQRKVNYVNKHSSQANSIWALDPAIVNLAEWADLWAKRVIIENLNRYRLAIKDMNTGAQELLSIQQIAEKLLG